MKLMFFDCNCIFGRRRDRKINEPFLLRDLKNDMVHFGIRKALVVHAASRDYNPSIGNMDILSITNKDENLFAVWAILPEATGELPNITIFLEQFFKKKIKAIIAFPKLHKFSLSEWSIGHMLKAFEEKNIPLLLPFSETSWDDIYLLCKRYPSLPLIITGIDYRQLRYLLQLWQLYKNLYIDTSWLSINGIFEYLYKKGYVQNLLFGTNYPVYSPGAAVTMITYADISEENKSKIAGKNLLNLLDKIKTE